MPFYVSGYDTEAIYPYWEMTKGQTYAEAVSYEGTRLRECLDGIRAVAEVHLRHEAAATFFLVARLVEAATPELRAILDHPLFDLECHSYTHCGIGSDDAESERRELVDSKKLIEDAFGRPVVGMTAPGGHEFGMIGHQLTLEIMAAAGYGYLRAVGLGPRGTTPAPLTQPFWYAEDGFPDLLEMPTHAWHDNILTGQPGHTHWPPVLPWPHPSTMPTTAAEVYAAYAPGIDYIAARDLQTYTPAFHPWSLYRVDPAVQQIDLLLSHAARVAQNASCTQVYHYIREHRASAAAAPPAALVQAMG